MSYSASKAAELAGVSVPTITRAIKSGRLSARKLDDGKGYEIDGAELARVFPLKPVSNDTPNTLSRETPNETGVLEVEVKMLRERLADTQAVVDDLREDRDRWRDMAETTTRLLPAPAPQTAQERPRRSWWPFGRSND